MKVDFRGVRQTRKHSVATPPTNEDLRASIRVAARQARYNPDNDPVLKDFKKRMRDIRISS